MQLNPSFIILITIITSAIGAPLSNTLCTKCGKIQQSLVDSTKEWDQVLEDKLRLPDKYKSDHGLVESNTMRAIEENLLGDVS
jgi:hypothetical protein